MEHIDEGTIHAWLDGALPPDGAGRVESHVAECATCAATVAEARGLIAASSRILSALDDVPGGVIPTGASVVPAPHIAADAGTRTSAAEVVELRPAAMSGASTVRRRAPWWRRPQFAAAAGIAFVAVTTTLVLQRQSAPNVGDFARASLPASESAPMSPPSQDLSSTAADEAKAGRGEPSAAGAAAAAANVASAEQRREADVSPSRSAKRPPDASTREASAREASARDASDRSDRTVVTAEQAGDSMVAGRARLTAASPAAPPVPATKPADSAAAKRPLALSADAVTGAEKARVAGERDVQLQSVVVTGSTRSLVSASEAATVNGIVGCYRLQRTTSARDGGVPELVALDATVVSGDGDVVLRTARALGAPAVEGTAWRWSVTPRGEVALVRVERGLSANFPIAIRLAAQTGETSIAQRTSCPAP